MEVGGFMIENNATLWLHIASWNFQLSWKSKMEPSVAIKQIIVYLLNVAVGGLTGSDGLRRAHVTNLGY